MILTNLCSWKFCTSSTHLMVSRSPLHKMGQTSHHWTVEKLWNSKITLFSISCQLISSLSHDRKKVSLERGKITRKFRLVRCELFWHDSWISPVHLRDNFWPSCRDFARIRTRSPAWRCYRQNLKLTKIGSMTNCHIFSKSSTSSHHVDRQLLCSLQILLYYSRDSIRSPHRNVNFPMKFIWRLQ